MKIEKRPYTGVSCTKTMNEISNKELLNRDTEEDGSSTNIITKVTLSR